MSKRNFCTLVSAVVVACLLSSGCNLRPDWGPPGTIGMQRSRAMVHDPFPSNELGPPIVGGRPPGFDLPKSQADQLQSSPYARRGARGGQYTPAYGF